MEGCRERRRIGKQRREGGREGGRRKEMKDENKIDGEKVRYTCMIIISVTTPGIIYPASHHCLRCKIRCKLK